MTELRKVFICKSCEGIYADEPVTACDCMPSKNHVYEFEQAYVFDSDTRKMVLDLCNAVYEHVSVWKYPYGRQTLKLAKQISEKLEAGE